MPEPTDPDRAPSTRLALQAVAEHVLAAAQHAATGHIGLRLTPGGFGTRPFPSAAGPRVLRVEGTELVRTDERGEQRRPLTTLRAAAELAGIEAGAPASVYAPTTPLEPDAELVVDPAAAARLAGWYALVQSLLEELVVGLGAGHPDTEPQLWPEHFDLAVTIDAVNYGGSPGDAGHPEPYLYVGPHAPPEPDGEFWNGPFGASWSAPVGGLPAPDAARAFLAEGRRLSDALGRP